MSMLSGLPLSSHPDLLVGREKASDSGIYRLTDDVAIVQSVDFFTPLMDDPYLFGQIAAANSLSDIYAAGARPVTAMNIFCFPAKELPPETAREILRGGIDKVHEAGAVLVGGHSVEDKEPKYGLAVTGVVHPEHFVTNAGARPGDHLFLTKPLGTGVLATAYKAGLLSKKAVARMVEVMVDLNRAASEAMMEVGVHAATDVTGFGLVGHALEMAEASNVTLEIEAESVPVMSEAIEYASMGFLPEGDYANREFCAKLLEVRRSCERSRLDILFDAQTSGGLLISVPPSRSSQLFQKLLERGVVECAKIGEVKGEGCRLIIS